MGDMMHQLHELIIEISHNCNLSCIMCGYGQQPNSPGKFIDLHLFNHILETVGCFADNIRLNGRGESTIHPQFPEMLQRTRESYPQKNITLFTNFSFRNDSILQAIVDAEVQLFISIDSPQRGILKKIRHGCDYDQIVMNIEGLKSLKNRPFIVITLQEDNLFQIRDIAEFALKHDCNLLYNVVRRDEGIEPFQRMVEINKFQIENDFRLVKEMYETHRLNCIIPDQISGIALTMKTSTKTYGNRSSCPAISDELCILYNGDVTPCNMFNPYVFGNIGKDDINAIMRGELREDFISIQNSYYYCQNCACMGGT